MPGGSPYSGSLTLFCRYAIPRESPYGNVPTVLESVEIDDPWVFNALVDRARIENSLLLDSVRSLLLVDYPILTPVRRMRQCPS